jgi:hypothetical protein
MGDIVDDDCHKTSNQLVKKPWLGVAGCYIMMGFGAKGGHVGIQWLYALLEVLVPAITEDTGTDSVPMFSIGSCEFKNGASGSILC